jgi:F420-0:gamma-glutamyl ligase-like protein
MRFVILLQIDGELPAEPARRIRELLALWKALTCVPGVWAVELPKAGARYAETMLEQLEDVWGDDSHVRAMVIPVSDPSVTFRMLDSRAASLLESP